jgi:NadR type nicotinamide-nucleotide adenylyltransferase
MEKRNEKLSDIGRIAITGPESTGKSILSEILAQYYDTVWVPEYAREYLAGIGREYCFEDIVRIAQGQLLREESSIADANKILFCDTELIVTKIWSEFKFKKCDPWIINNIPEHKYDLYLLCDIDLPWEPDPLREHPEQRQQLFDLYQSELEMQKFPYGIVKGNGIKRFNCALELINKHFSVKF